MRINLTPKVEAWLIKQYEETTHSLAEIARDFPGGGATKNSVAGHISRLIHAGKLKSRSPDAAAAKINRDRAVERRIMQQMFRGGCRYIAGPKYEGEHSWCGKPCVDAKPWCAEHLAIIYVPHRKKVDGGKL